MELTKTLISSFNFSSEKEDAAVNSLPKGFVALAALLLVARVVDIGFTLASHSAHANSQVSAIAAQPASVSPDALPWAAIPANPTALIKAKIAKDRETMIARSKAMKAQPAGKSGVAVLAQMAQPETDHDMSAETNQFLNDVTANATAQKKYVVFEFAADWSDPCRTMESTALVNPTVTALLKEHFVPIRMRNLEKEIGSNTKVVSELAKKYRVFAYPTLVVVGDDGKLVTSMIGNCSALTTCRFLSRSLVMARKA